MRLHSLPSPAVLACLALLAPAARAADNPHVAARSEVRARTADLLGACDALQHLPQERSQLLNGAEGLPASPSPEAETCAAVRNAGRDSGALAVGFALLWAFTFGVGIAGVTILFRSLGRLFSTPWTQSLLNRP